jgi:DNA-binding transcriptional LysR family regulator
MVITPLRLRHAASLAEHASFRRAAATLRISQPALTKSVQALETALGVKLFERRREGVVPTEFGRLVIEYARGLAHAETELHRQVQLLAGLETGSLDVAFGPLPGAMSVYPAAGALLGRHPNLRISLRSMSWREVVQAVIDKRVDLGVAEVSATAHAATLQIEPIGQHRVHFLCRAGHPILGDGAVGLPQLLQYPWATTRLPSRMASALPADTGRAGHIDTLTGDFVPAIDVWSPHELAVLIADSDALALGPLSLVEQELDSGVLAVVPTRNLEFRGGYGFIHLKSRPVSPSTRAFMDEIRVHEKLVARQEARLERLFRRSGQKQRD